MMFLPEFMRNTPFVTGCGIVAMGCTAKKGYSKSIQQGGRREGVLLMAGDGNI